MFTLLVGCSTETSGITNDNFNQEAIEVIKMIDLRMENGEKLNSQEKHKINLFFEKYGLYDNSNKYKTVLLNINSLYTSHDLSISAYDSSTRNDNIAEYLKIHKELEQQLGL
jgi:hypothetical protein